MGVIDFFLNVCNRDKAIPDSTMQDILKRQVMVRTYPMTFEEDYKACLHRNCYGYVLGLTQSDRYKKWYIPGWISDRSCCRPFFDTTALINRIKNDLALLGFTWRENSENLREGEFRIAIYAFNSAHDLPIEFHMARQNADGGWSEKWGWKGKPSKLDYKGIDGPDVEGADFKQILIVSKK